MSECIVEVCRIDRILPHSNADALELAQIKGWQCVVPLGRYKEGDLVTYIPIDSMIPLIHGDRWGITKYLSVKPNADAGRVRCARLRGEPSFGVIIDREVLDWPEGYDVKEHYGITKYIPPIRPTAGDTEHPHPLFVEYTEIENLRHFPTLFEPGEEVVISEKIHGTNCRVGLVEGEWMAGSKTVRRKPPVLEAAGAGIYWSPLVLPGVRSLIEDVGSSHRQVILFGEVFGTKIQSFTYGLKNAVAFRAFDLLVDGRYLDAHEFLGLCVEHNVQTAPVLYKGPFSLDAVRARSGGQSALGAEHIREGVVVRPIVERLDPKVGRVILKYIGDQYLLSKTAEEDVLDV